MSRATNDYRRAELAQARSARRSRREQENYFRRTPPEQQRANNVARAMADGSFAKTRFEYEKTNPKYAMDGAGNIRAKTREENIAEAKKDGTFAQKVAEFNAASKDSRLNAKGEIDLVMPKRKAPPPPKPGPAPVAGDITLQPGGAGLIDGELAARFVRRESARDRDPSKCA